MLVESLTATGVEGSQFTSNTRHPEDLSEPALEHKALYNYTKSPQEQPSQAIPSPTASEEGSRFECNIDATTDEESLESSHLQWGDPLDRLTTTHAGLQQGASEHRRER